MYEELRFFQNVAGIRGKGDRSFRLLASRIAIPFTTNYILNFSVGEMSDKSLDTLIEILTQYKSFKKLILGDDFRNVSVDKIRKFAAVLETYPNLRCVGVTFAFLESNAACALVIGLMKNTSLSSLNLSASNMGSEIAQIIATELSIEGSALKELNLTYNLIGTEGAIYLAEALQRNPKLKILKLGRNFIETAGIKAIGAALQQNTNLKALYLTSNEITAEGAASIAAALERNTTLAILDLSDNRIYQKDAETIALSLQSNSALKELNLEQNYIGDAGASVFARCLEQNTSVTKLNLSANQITDQGVVAIAKALKQNRTLTHLDLSRNEIGEKGALALVKALESNSTLVQLKIWYKTDIPLSILDTIEYYLLCNRRRLARETGRIVEADEGPEETGARPGM